LVSEPRYGLQERGRATAGVDLSGGKLIQHVAGRTLWLGPALFDMCARRLLGDMRLRARRLNRNNDLWFFVMTARAALASLHDDSLGPAAAHVLAHGSLREPGWLQREGLLTRYVESLVVVVVRHSASVFQSFRATLVRWWSSMRSKFSRAPLLFT
jgi:hypothetical protein